MSFPVFLETYEKFLGSKQSLSDDYKINSKSKELGIILFKNYKFYFNLRILESSYNKENLSIFFTHFHPLSRINYILHKNLYI